MNDIEVIMHFAGDFKTKILKFKMDGIVYDCGKLTPTFWTMKHENELVTHFYVICEEKNVIAELRLYNNTNKWELIKMEQIN